MFVEAPLYLGLLFGLAIGLGINFLEHRQNEKKRMERVEIWREVSTDFLNKHFDDKNTPIHLKKEKVEGLFLFVLRLILEMETECE